MSKDPANCSVTGCTKKPMYKIGAKGFCEDHKPKLKKPSHLSVDGVLFQAKEHY